MQKVLFISVDRKYLRWIVRNKTIDVGHSLQKNGLVDWIIIADLQSGLAWSSAEQTSERNRWILEPHRLTIGRYITHWLEHWLEFKVKDFICSSLDRSAHNERYRAWPRAAHTAFNNINHESVTWNEIRRNPGPIPPRYNSEFSPPPPSLRRSVR